MRDLELWELCPAPATRNAKNRYPLDQGGRAPGQEGPGRSRYPSWLPGRRGEAREVLEMQKKRHCLEPGDGKRTRSLGRSEGVGCKHAPSAPNCSSWSRGAVDQSRGNDECASHDQRGRLHSSERSQDPPRARRTAALSQSPAQRHGQGESSTWGEQPRRTGGRRTPPPQPAAPATKARAGRGLEGPHQAQRPCTIRCHEQRQNKRPPWAGRQRQ